MNISRAGAVQTGGRLFKGTLGLALKNLFLPAFCRGCRTRILSEGNLYFCGSCWSSIELVHDPRCPRCGRPHPVRVGFEQIDNFVCSDCFNRKHWAEKTFAAGLHVGVLRDAIHLLKYRKKRLLAEPLAQLLFQVVAAKVEIKSYDMLVPVPLHRNRLKERGFNQSELIGSYLCKETEVPIASILKRVKDTPSFSMLGAPERRDLIQKAFELDSDAQVKEKRVLLIDDVVTTGATSSECAKVLRKKGASVVDVIALAVVGRS